MRINVHAHIFNLQTVLTGEAVNVMVQRLADRGFPPFIVEAARKFLDEQLTRPEFLVEEDLLRRFVSYIAEQPGFKAFASNPGLPVDIRLLGDGLTDLTVGSLRTVLNRLSTVLDARDSVGSSVADLFATLLLAMQPEVVDVADELLRHLGPEDAIVALMMDIVARDEKPRDKKKFLAQLKGTARAAVARPGRILPFVGINPIRPNHFDVMRTALEELGFVGVKIYPALGFEVTSPPMLRVFDHCARFDVPIVVHTTAGGFAKTQQTAQFGDPAHWKKIFKDRPELRVSFAHCGGWGGLAGHLPSEKAWADQIFEYMDQFENVYTDISFHVAMMGGGEPENLYLPALRAHLAHPTRGKRILFGTDSWLLRLSQTDEAFWNYFQNKLTPAEFRQIATDGPRQFLGLPDDNGSGARPNVARYLAFLNRNRNRVGDMPTAWVRAALPGVVFVPERVNPRWSPNNRAHVLTFKFFRFDVNQIPPQHHNDKFADSGKLRLRQLGYFTKDHEDAATYNKRRRSTAMKMDAFLRTNGATFEGDFEPKAAVDRIDQMLDDGNRTLAEAAAAVDAVYLFGEEL
jgi:predicted TIM-barrel fold metal-dependent hydrolase